MVGSNSVVPVIFDRNCRMFSILAQNRTPMPKPKMVPTTPIDAPEMKKTRITAPRVAPMVRSMAMSPDLSFTSMVRPDTMFSAATRMISDRIRNITLASTLIASNSWTFRFCQGMARVVGPAAFSSAGIIARSFSGSATITSMPLTVSP